MADLKSNDAFYFEAGRKEMKQIAIEAFKEVLDKFYDSGFDPTIDYNNMFLSKINDGQSNCNL